MTKRTVALVRSLAAAARAELEAANHRRHCKTAHLTMTATVPRHALQALLNPRSGAVIGASEDQIKFGGRRNEGAGAHRYRTGMNLQDPRTPQTDRSHA